MPDIVVLLDDQVVRRVALGREPITIGRTDANSLSVEDMSISRHHARIDEEAGRYFLIDLDSANGTFVNGQPITRARIYHSDRIGVGKHQLLFLAPNALPDGMAPPESFVAEAEETIVLPQMTDQAYLTLRPGRRPGSVHALPVPVATVGRSEECDVRVVDWFVEPLQARIELDGPDFLLRPLGESGGIRLNGSPVEVAAQLRPGDVIEMGVTRLIFSLDAAEADAARSRRLPDYLPVAAVPEDPSIEAALDAALAEAGEDLQVREEIAPPAPEESQAAGAKPKLETPDANRKVRPTEEPFEFDADESRADPETEAAHEAAAPESEAPDADLKVRPAEEPFEFGAHEARGDLKTETAHETSAPPPVPESLTEPPAASPAELAQGADQSSEKDRKKVEFWERALQNPSAAVRKQATEQLQRLTGRDRV